MTDKTSRVILKYEVDKTTLAQVDRSVTQLETRLDAVAKAQREVNQSAKLAGDSIRKAFQDPGNRPLQRLVEERKAIEGTTAALKERIKQQRAAELASGSRGDNRSALLGLTGGARGGALTESIGQGSTALGGLASVARGVGGTAGGEALAFSGDVLGAVEGVSKLRGELGGLIKALPEAGGLTGKLAGAIGGAGSLAVVAGAGAAAVGILALGIKNFENIVQPASDALIQASNQLTAYYGALKTGTAESIQTQLKALEIDKQIADAELKQRETARLNALGAARDSGNVIQQVAGAFAGLGKGFQENAARIDELKKQSLDASGKIAGLTSAMNSSEVAANNAAEAEKKLAVERTAGIERQMQEELALQALVKTGTRKQVRDQIDDLRLQADAVANAYSKALEKNDAASQELAKKLEKQYRELQDKIANREALLPILDARDKESKAIRQVTDDTLALSEANRRLSESMQNRKRELTQGEQDEIAAAEEARQEQLDGIRDYMEAQDKAAAEQQKRDEDLVNITQKYTADRNKIEEDALKARADIDGQYADKLVDIARTAAEAAADNLLKLQQAREDLTRGAVRDEEKAQRDAAVKALDVQISAAREDEKSAREHYRRMDQIRRDAQDREADMILNRDFLALFQSRRQTVADLRNENTGFTTDQQERQIAAGQQLDDLRRSIANERQERLIAYQQQLQDAQITYQRDMEQAAQARNRALQLAAEEKRDSLIILQQKVAAELAIRQQAAAQEIRLSQMTAQQRNALFTQELMQARQIQAQLAGSLVTTINQARAALASASQRSALAGMLSRAGGGWLGAGQSALVNDAYPGQRESFGGSLFPAGLGVFTPVTGGMVSAGNRTASNTWNIQGNDPQAIWQFIEPRLKASMASFLGGL